MLPRILITSTTNAAVDQDLSKLMELAPARDALERGEIVRVGQGGEHSDASLHQVVEKLNQQTRQQLGLFAVAEPSALSPWQLSSAFGERYVSRIVGLATSEQQRLISGVSASARDGTGPAYRARGGAQSRPAP